MARLPRLNVPGQVHHVILRALQPLLIAQDDADFEFLHGLLVQHAPRLGVQLHAYVLLNNQYQLVLTPQQATSLPGFMQAIGRDYVRYYNQRYGRSGTLWDGRYRCTIVESAAWIMDCLVSVAWAPVYDQQATSPEAYLWSSYRYYAGAAVDKALTPPSAYWALGNTPFAREAAFQELVQKDLSRERRTCLEQAVWGGWALGSEDFLHTLQLHTQRRISQRKPGRPRATA